MSESVRDLLRQLPAVNTLLEHPIATALEAQYGREALVDALRVTLDDARQRLLAGEHVAIANEALLAATAQSLEVHFAPTLRPVINATGVIIHTNLGRALLSKAAQTALQAVAANYNNLEFNLGTGKRGSRYTHAEQLLCELTGAEAALVVNNNAAALVLLLGALAQGREVVISRSELVEIGGGFRIPDIMAQSGAYLVEVGTTNRTRLRDYEHAITEDTAMLLRVHSSNFKIIGFVEDADLAEMAQLAQARDVLLVNDLGSGALLDTAAYGLAPEPTIQQSVQAGVDCVLFSGDKLLGGPQAGILVGKKAIIQRMKRHPLARALRTDKLAYAALSATLDHYRRGEATTHIPVWQMIAMPLTEIEKRVQHWAQQVGGVVIRGESTVGGGSLPGTTLPTALLALDVPAPDAFMKALREADTPIIARIADDRVLFDPRTVLPAQDTSLLQTIQALQSAFFGR